MKLQVTLRFYDSDVLFFANIRKRLGEFICNCLYVYYYNAYAKELVDSIPVLKPPSLYERIEAIENSLAEIDENSSGYGLIKTLAQEEIAYVYKHKPGTAKLVIIDIDDENLYPSKGYYKGEFKEFVVHLLYCYCYNDSFADLVDKVIINAEHTNVEIPDEFKKDPSILDIATDRKFALIRPEYIKKDLTKYVDKDSHTYRVARFTQVLAKWLVSGVDASKLSTDEQSTLLNTNIRRDDIVDIYDILNCNIVGFDLEKASLQEVAM